MVHPSFISNIRSNLGVWRRFRAILARFSFSVLLSIYITPRELYIERNTEKLNLAKNRSKTPPNAMETQVIHTKRKGKSILLFSPLILNKRPRGLNADAFL